jgi:hypothetical protein
MDEVKYGSIVGKTSSALTEPQEYTLVVFAQYGNYGTKKSNICYICLKFSCERWAPQTPAAILSTFKSH